ncbi:MAG TPA: ornithine carbamoyltransferase, partial [Lachnospiraceae bacterium]|nr:ornithine carbamoyltransferase [Lachnospiraceae bacterium]
MDLKGRDFLTLRDFTPEEIRYMTDHAKELKEMKKKGIAHRNHEG